MKIKYKPNLPSNLRPQAQDSLFDGCEYLDDGNYGKENTNQPPEPWRAVQYSEPIVLLPKKFALSLMDKRYRAEIQISDRKKIETLQSDIATTGLRSPGIIYYDTQGSICIYDGNHRVLAIANIVSMDFIPFRVKQSSGRVKVGTLNLVSKLPELLEKLGQESLDLP